MADTPVEFWYATGQNLNLRLYPFGNDSIANGISGDNAIEATNRHGLYSGIITESLYGWHSAHLYNADNNAFLGGGYVYMTDDTDIKKIVDWTGIVDIYHADIDLTLDSANARDEYTVVWFKNGIRINSGITSPTIQVIKRGDGTDLVAETPLTEIGSTHIFKFDESANRVTRGESYLVIARATIDNDTQYFPYLLSRDRT